MSIALAFSANNTLYAARADGQVFLFVKRGDIDPATGFPSTEPCWRPVPPVPGTEAAAAADG